MSATKRTVEWYEHDYKVGKYLVVIGVCTIPLAGVGIIPLYIGLKYRQRGFQKKNRMLRIQREAKLAQEAAPNQTSEKETITRERVLVACGHCGSRSVQGTPKCPNCGARL